MVAIGGTHGLSPEVVHLIGKHTVGHSLHAEGIPWVTSVPYDEQGSFPFSGHQWYRYRYYDGGRFS